MKTKILFILVGVLAFGTAAQAQIRTGVPPVVKTVKIVQPIAALKGAEEYEKNGKQYHRIVLTITNYDKLNASTFVTDTSVKLPPNPCSEMNLRVAVSVLSEDDSPLLTCRPARIPSTLSQISFSIEKGKPIPPFVYVVLTDRMLGHTYKSNLVSPWNGKTK